MERLNQIKPPEIVRMPRGEWKLFTDESRIERLALKQGSEYVPTFEIELARRDDGLWFWAMSAYVGMEGCAYGLQEECGVFTKTKQEAINAAALEIIRWAKNKRLNNKCIEWLLSVAQQPERQGRQPIGESLAMQGELF